MHIATIAPQSTDEAIRLMLDLENLPVDGVMIFPAAAFCLGESGCDLKVRFFEDLARGTNLPLVLFQIPVKATGMMWTLLAVSPTRKRRRV